MPEKLDREPKETPARSEASEALRGALETRGLTTRFRADALAVCPEHPFIAESAGMMGEMMQIFRKRIPGRKFNVAHLESLREAIGEDRCNEFRGASTSAASAANRMIRLFVDDGFMPTLFRNVDWLSDLSQEVPLQKFLREIYGAIFSLHAAWQREVFPPSKRNVSIMHFDQIEQKREEGLHALIAQWERIPADARPKDKPNKPTSPMVVEDELRRIEEELLAVLANPKPDFAKAAELGLQLMGTSLLLAGECGAGYENGRIIQHIGTQQSFRWDFKERSGLITDAVAGTLGRVRYAKRIAAQYT